jgi:hypothetical protein
LAQDSLVTQQNVDMLRADFVSVNDGDPECGGVHGQELAADTK